ncbi:MAG: hypothetical protein Q4E67_08290, partial [Planctomycetia bacterium]|nr:hypothetical protein [Planctomycetia bacterium]
LPGILSPKGGNGNKENAPAAFFPENYNGLRKNIAVGIVFICRKELIFNDLQKSQKSYKGLGMTK